MADQTGFDAIELTSVRLSADGRRLVLFLRDASGQTVSLSLPTTCVNSLMSAVPQPPDIGTLHTLDTWSMEPAGNGRDMLLTLRTPEGLAISFAAKPWQVEGMATIATYGRGDGSAPKVLH